MSTFNCPNQCKELCQSCQLNPNWEKLLTDKMLFEKDRKTINTLNFSQKERKLLKTIFSKIPDSLFDKKIKGLVKLEHPIAFYEKRNSLSYIDGYIIIYKEAFNRRDTLTRKFVHELIHHYHEYKGRSVFKKYKAAIGWKANGKKRPGKFLSADSKHSPQEDFAENLESYIFQPEKLRQLNPKIYTWIKKHFKNDFKIKECHQ